MRLPAAFSNHQTRMFLLAACACFSLGGCQILDKKETPPEPGKVAVNENGQPIYAVTADYTPFYRLGPQQANGPDQSLVKGTQIGLVKKSMGYSQVVLEGGLIGYVANEDIAPAPPQAAAPPASGESAIVEHFSVDNARNSAATSTGNAEALPELPEPNLDPEPIHIEKPDFRY